MMKIFYFTGTGNSLYVAQQLGGELLSIPQVMKDDRIEILSALEKIKASLSGSRKCSGNTRKPDGTWLSPPSDRRSSK